MLVRVMRTPTPLQLTRKINKRIRKLQDMRPVMEAIGKDHIETIQHRIAVGVDYRDRALTPLSALTIALREYQGNTRVSPLWDSGQMKSSWGIKVTKRSVIVKPTTRLDRKKVSRDMYGGLSTKLRRPVPVRNPFSVSKEQRFKYAQWIKFHVLGSVK